MITIPDGKILVGVDEVGYGCLAGDVTVCAVHIPLEYEFEVKAQGFRDSKKLSKPKMKDMVNWVQANSGKVRWGLSSRSPQAIDEYGPVDARNMAAMTALILLEKQIGVDLSQFHIVMDGAMELPSLPAGTTQQALPKADDLVLPVSVASVIAKVTRDQDISRYHDRYPLYGFDSHVGYGTPKHIETLYRLGPVPGLYRSVYLKTAIHNYSKKHNLPLPKWFTATFGK